jgi:hypothetical protein
MALIAEAGGPVPVDTVVRVSSALCALPAGEQNSACGGLQLDQIRTCTNTCTLQHTKNSWCWPHVVARACGGSNLLRSRGRTWSEGVRKRTKTLTTSVR